MYDSSIYEVTSIPAQEPTPRQDTSALNDLQSRFAREEEAAVRIQVEAGSTVLDLGNPPEIGT